MVYFAPDSQSLSAGSRYRSLGQSGRSCLLKLARTASDGCEEDTRAALIQFAKARKAAALEMKSLEESTKNSGSVFFHRAPYRPRGTQAWAIRCGRHNWPRGHEVDEPRQSTCRAAFFSRRSIWPFANASRSNCQPVELPAGRTCRSRLHMP